MFSMDKPDNNIAAIAATEELKALFEIDASHRQGAWHYRLMTCLPHAVFASGEPEIIFNPAGLTYYNLELNNTSCEKGTPQKSYTLPELIDTFLIQEGVGVAIEAHDPKLAIDLSYGDILGFHLHRTFSEPKDHSFITDKPRAGLIREGADLLISEVPATILPPTTIKLLEDIMQHLGISEPSIKLVYLPETKQNEIVFSMPTNQLKPSQTQQLIQKLGWFLPRYYSYLACDLNNVSPLVDTQLNH